MPPGIRDTSQTIQERIAATHVNSLDVDLDSMAAISNIFRVAVMFRNLSERRFLLKHNLTFSGFTVLWVLWVFGKMESYQLAEECGISKGTLTGIVSTLEKHGLIRRIRHPLDGRRKIVMATDRGRTLMRRLFPKINRLEREFVRGLESKELSSLARMLRIILHSQDTP